MLSTQQWKNSFKERKFSIIFNPSTYNNNDYKMAWYWAFLYYPGTHSWFFNFHDNFTNMFPIYFYYWWTLFGCSTSILLMTKKNLGNTSTKTHQPSNHTQKKSNFSELSTLHGFLVGSIDSTIICLIHFHYRLSVFTKLNGGTSTKRSYVTVAPPVPRAGSATFS